MSIAEFFCFKLAMFCLRLSKISYLFSTELGDFFIEIGDKIRDIWVKD